ncbi:hypothetical protein AN214_04354 [Pseudoalteromonas sp. P1-9]|uniref:hypothetical protein n=1 Tax=Pseudoalteromonas sp. P1-9 TaxID=1710354 RepID=UPI0006D604A4|nr:hypothetical protein [Pseudoalteromonas sp. P1-9]KPV93611.1 hypothetical protein AN214_04354 [Pseudoalteromonas sp. P1-9]
MSFEFNEIYGTNESRLEVHDEACDEALRLIKKGNFDLLWLWGNKNNFERLNDVDLSDVSFKGINFLTGQVKDISWIGRVKSLESLTIKGNTKGSIDFEGLPNLKGCDLDFSKGTASIIDSAIKIDRLGLSRLSAPLSDFNNCLASSLKILGVSGHKLSTLEGIEKFSNLECLGIYTNKGLTDIKPITQLAHLKRLQFEGVNNIENLEILGQVSTLEKLTFECKVLPSLKLLLPAPNLESIYLGDNTLIEDRDIEVALDFPKLGYFSFAKKKGYKYDAIQLKEAIEQKQNI